MYARRPFTSSALEALKIAQRRAGLLRHPSKQFENPGSNGIEASIACLVWLLIL